MNPEKSELIFPSSRSITAIVFAIGLLVALIGVLSLCAAEPAALSGPWKHLDIGKAEVPGQAAIAGGAFSIKGTQDIWGTNDGFHFVFQAFAGDGEIVARVKSVQNTLNHAKGGVMIREAMTPGAKEVCMAVTPVDGAQFLFRPEADGATKVAKLATTSKGTFPYWVKLVRKGDLFSGYESLDGKAWSLTGSTNVSMSGSAMIGLTASSHVKDVLCEAVFDEVSVKPAAKQP